MKKIVILLVFALSLFGADLNWSHDYSKSVKKAKEQNKGLYVLITSDRCGWCRKFEESTAVDKGVLEKLKKDYVIVQLSKQRHSVPGYLTSRPVPIHHFLNNNEEVVYSTIGYRPAESFGDFIDEATKKLKK